MLPIHRQSFEAWYHAPVAASSPDPRFDVERVGPDAFEAIYDLVDAAFGVNRSRKLYDWLYRLNPLGVARCWVVRERATGALVGSAGAWPWPLARGSDPVQATLNGDEATAPGWQRQGVAEANREVFAQHPWYTTGMMLGWPNFKTVARLQKRGRAHRIVGPLPRATLVLRGRRAPPRDAAAGIAVEEVSRFDSTFDALTARHMAWDGFWCPHDSALLEWRYRHHPTREYVAFVAAGTGDDPLGYTVVRVGGRRAMLTELVAPVSPDPVASALLRAARGAATAAGCSRLDFFAPPGWRHWALLRELGFADRDSEIFLFTRDQLGPETRDIDRWQCVPGDHDDV